MAYNDPMTQKQREVLLIIAGFWKKFGYGPSIRDIMRLRKGNNSSGGTFQVVGRLEDAGWVTTSRGKAKRARARGREVTEEGMKMLQKGGKFETN